MRNIRLFLFLFGLSAAAAAQSQTSVCEQCKSMVQYFVDAPTDSVKMSKLKVSLSMMCAGTSHQEDCFKTLNHFDFISRKLSKYLKNTEAVCSKLQMCSNDKKPSEISSELSRIAMLFVRKSESDLMNDNIMKKQICEECKEASLKIDQQISSPETLIVTTSLINKFVCQSAGIYKDQCNEFTISVLPSLLAGLHEILSDHQTVCGDLNLCEKSKIKFEETKPVEDAETIWQEMGIVKMEHGEELMSCFECTLTVDSLIEEFLAKRQKTADDIQNEVCSRVVGNWTDGCNDFLQMYLSTVLYLTYNQFDGRQVCVAMHSCQPKNDFSQISIEQNSRNKCEKCDSFEKFLAQNAPRFQPNVAASISSNFCQKLPTSLNSLCIRSAHLITSRFFKQLALISKNGKICSKIC